MISAPQPAVVHLFTIFRQIGAGDLRIPAFQREFVWKDKQIVELLSSVREQYPIGSILLWHVDRKMLEIASGRVTAFPNVPERYPTNYILDGMQRLSTLYGSFHFEPGKNRSFNVYYDLRNREFFHFDDREVPDEEASIPLASLIAPRRMLEHQSRLASLDDGDELLDELLEMQAAFQDYMVPVVTIQGADVERIVGIFERTNSTGTRLDTVDFMRAITWDQAFDLNEYLDSARAPLAALGFELPDETIIKCVGLILGVNPSDEGLLSLRSRRPEELRDAFAEFQPALLRVLKFLQDKFRIRNFAYVPYEGQLLVLFKAIGLGEAETVEDSQGLERWFWAAGFNESLRGKPDHYVVRAVDNWRGLIGGQIRGLESRLRLSEADFFERRLIRGKALSGAFATMFAVHGAKSLLSGEPIPPALYMSEADLSSFQVIVSGRELRESGLDVGPSPRVFPNVVLANLAENFIEAPDWRTCILRMAEARRMDVLASQFIDEDVVRELASGSTVGFLRKRAATLRAKARTLVED